MYLRRIDLLTQERRQISLSFKQEDDFLQMTERHHLMLEEFAASVNGRLRVIAGGNDKSPSFRPAD